MKPRPLTGAYIDFATLIFHISELKDSSDDPERWKNWILALYKCIGSRNPELSEFGAILLENGEGYREEQRERTSKSREKKKAEDENKSTDSHPSDTPSAQENGVKDGQKYQDERKGLEQPSKPEQKVSPKSEENSQRQQDVKHSRPKPPFTPPPGLKKMKEDAERKRQESCPRTENLSADDSGIDEVRVPVHSSDPVSYHRPPQKMTEAEYMTKHAQTYNSLRASITDSQKEESKTDESTLSVDDEREESVIPDYPDDTTDDFPPDMDSLEISIEEPPEQKPKSKPKKPPKPKWTAETFRVHVVREYSTLYDAELLDAFCTYWTERKTLPDGTSDGQMKFQKMQTFEIGKRLSMWKRKSDEFSSNRAQYNNGINGRYPTRAERFEQSMKDTAQYLADRFEKEDQMKLEVEEILGA